jgi:TRAP transporter TAXI family solute receptor
MTTRTSWIAVLLVLGAALGAPARAAEPNWPDTLVLATASPGGTYHAYGMGLARVLTRALGVAVSVRETDGPIENIQLIEAGRAQLGFVTTGAALQAWSGAGDWTQGQRYGAITAIFPMYDTPFHFVTRRDSPIRSLADFTGRAVGAGPPGGTAATYAPRLLASLGIEARLVHGTWADLAEDLRAGRIDGLAVAAGVPFPAIAELEARRAIRYLPLTREQVLTLRLAVPELGASVIPAGTYPSLMAGYETVGLYNIAVAHRALPTDLVYAIVKAVFDHHAEMVEAHPAAAATVPGNFVHNTVLPWHPGALRYFENRAVRGVVTAD